MRKLFSLMKIFNETTSMSIEFLQEGDKILFFDDDGESYEDYHTIHQKHVFPDEKMQDYGMNSLKDYLNLTFRRLVAGFMKVKCAILGMDGLLVM